MSYFAQISYGRFAPSGLSFADAPVKRSSQRELGYFGTRYYDGDIGLWTSVDAARQHWSPYLYGSNNPVMRVDPDGNEDEVFDADHFVKQGFGQDMQRGVKLYTTPYVVAGALSAGWALKGSGLSALFNRGISQAAYSTGSAFTLIQAELGALSTLEMMGLSLTFSLVISATFPESGDFGPSDIAGEIMDNAPPAAQVAFKFPELATLIFNQVDIPSNSNTVKPPENIIPAR